MLVQLCCREGGALQTNITGVCVEDPQCSGHTGFAPACSVCFPSLHCSVSRLLSRGWALSCVHFPGLSCSDLGFWILHKDTDSVGPAFCTFPAHTAQATRSLTSALSSVALSSAPYPLHGPSLSFWVCWSGAPCVCSGKLIFGSDPPGGCQPSRISESLWLETGSLFAVL